MWLLVMIESYMKTIRYQCFNDSYY